MGRMRIAFAALVVGIFGASLPARAAITCAETPNPGRRYIDIDVLEQGFSPLAQQAFAGDVVRWTVRSATQHEVMPHAPVDIPGWTKTLIAPGDVFCIKFAGGSVWYRDVRSQNSVLTDSGVCHGRCGSISDRTADPAAPAITPPAGPSEQRPTVIQGTSEPFTLVKLASVPAGETAYDAGRPVGQALANQAGAWTARLYLDGGSYSLVARAVDAAGRESVDSTAASGSSPVPLEVVADSEPPTVVANKPTPPVVLAETAVSGTANDNARVSKVIVVISDLRNGQNIGGSSGQMSFVLEAFNCNGSPCPPDQVSWSFTLKPTSIFKVGPLPAEQQPRTIGVPSGLFSVRITAFDAWLNASTTESFDVLVVAPPRIG